MTDTTEPTTLDVEALKRDHEILTILLADRDAEIALLRARLSRAEDLEHNVLIAKALIYDTLKKRYAPHGDLVTTLATLIRPN